MRRVGEGRRERRGTAGGADGGALPSVVRGGGGGGWRWEEEVEAVFPKEGGDEHAVHVLEGRGVGVDLEDGSFGVFLEKRTGRNEVSELDAMRVLERERE